MPKKVTQSKTDEVQEQVNNNDNVQSTLGFKLDEVNLNDLTTADKCKQHFEKLQNTYIHVTDTITELDAFRHKIVFTLATVQTKFKGLNSNKDDAPLNEEVQIAVDKALSKQAEEEDNQEDDEHNEANDDPEPVQEAVEPVKKTIVKKIVKTVKKKVEVSAPQEPEPVKEEPVQEAETAKKTTVVRKKKVEK